MDVEVVIVGVELGEAAGSTERSEDVERPREAIMSEEKDSKLGKARERRRKVAREPAVRGVENLEVGEFAKGVGNRSGKGVVVEVQRLESREAVSESVGKAAAEAIRRDVEIDETSPEPRAGEGPKSGCC